MAPDDMLEVLSMKVTISLPNTIHRQIQTIK